MACKRPCTHAWGGGWVSCPWPDAPQACARERLSGCSLFARWLWLAGCWLPPTNSSRVFWSYSLRPPTPYSIVLQSCGIFVCRLSYQIPYLTEYGQYTWEGFNVKNKKKRRKKEIGVVCVLCVLCTTHKHTTQTHNTHHLLGGSSWGLGIFPTDPHKNRGPFVFLCLCVCVVCLCTNTKKHKRP